MRLLQFNKFYSPTDGPTATADVDSGSSSGDLGKEEIIEILGEDSDTDVPLDLKEGDEEAPDEEAIKEDGEEPDDEISQELKELEGPNEEQLELIAPVRRKEILKKYPTLFKDFPYLEKAYYREQQYTELLPTLDDAKQAVEKGKTLDKFETDLLNGKSENILSAVKQINPKSFYKIVDDYLPALARVDEKAYHHVIGNVIKYTIINMSSEAKKLNNSGLQEAASILNQFVFGTADWKPPAKLSSDEKEEVNGKEKELQAREQELVQGRFNDARNGLNTRVNNALRNTIEANIDPRSSMTGYVKQNAIRDANENLEKLMSQDSRFKVMMDKLWEAAFKSNFSNDSTEKIRQAYLSRARTLLPEVIKRARNEALKGMGKRIKEDNGDVIKGKIKGQITPGAPRSNSGGKITKAGDIPKRMSTLDFLNSD